METSEPKIERADKTNPLNFKLSWKDQKSIKRHYPLYDTSSIIRRGFEEYLLEFSRVAYVGPIRDWEELIRKQALDYDIRKNIMHIVNPAQAYIVCAIIPILDSREVFVFEIANSISAAEAGMTPAGYFNSEAYMKTSQYGIRALR